jgi:predicted alpha-1,2-mannosidase
MKKIFTAFIAISLIMSCSYGEKNYTQYVNSFIGTGDHGHVFMGANVPFGFVQLGPTQYSQGWDWCSGYHYSDSTIIGFGHLHLSGTGIGDLGDISLMPAIGEIKMTRGNLEDPQSGIYSKFSHSRESARPGYYSVFLDRFGINVELTATQRVGFHKYTFPKSSESKVIFDLEHGIGWDSPKEGYMVQESDTRISGYRVSKGWAEHQEVYFTACFSKPFKEFKKHNSYYSEVLFETGEGEEIYVKVALSPVSIANAKLNMESELSGWDFAQTIREADKEWNKMLSKVDFETSNVSDKRIFYTAMYHSMVAPSVFCDVNGEYRGADLKVHKDSSFTNYTTFSLWDTYRAAHPLMTIIHQEKMKDIAQTMLNIYDQQGKLPVWHLMGNETNCMVGNPGIAALGDIALKGYDIDKERAFQAMKNSALLDERGLKWMKEYGYIPYDLEDASESVAKTMEYAIADWCVARLAKELGHDEDYDYFLNRSRAYRFFFDTQRQFVRGLSSKGVFREPFDPFRSSHRVDDYTEGNAWQYTWLVPHDVYGLIDIFGGEKQFISKLDSLFVAEGDMGAEASSDISGLIGQYAHGNEPSHHIIYLYPYAGQQWKCAEKVREVLTTLYHDAPAGLCGNEDVGQMSSWYIMSAMGFYQVAPAGGEYIFGSPIMDKAVIHLPDNKLFTIITHNNSRENKYIQSVKLNGIPYAKSYINHTDIVKGGTLEFFMSDNPSDFGTLKENYPLNN